MLKELEKDVLLQVYAAHMPVVHLGDRRAGGPLPYHPLIGHLNNHTPNHWLWTSSYMRVTLRANGIISECQKTPLNLLLLSDQPGLKEGGQVVPWGFPQRSKGLWESEWWDD